MSLVFDIKKFVVGKQKYEDYGYALFPLFDVLETDDDKSTTELYINSGMYTVITKFILHDHILVTNIQRVPRDISIAIVETNKKPVLDNSILAQIRQDKGNDPTVNNYQDS